jgi:PrtD family type I secretion system ABC transporter
MQRPKQPPNEVAKVLTASRSVFLSTGLFSGILNILALTGSIFMLQVYDRVLTSGSIPTLIALCLITLLLYSYYGFLDYIRSRIMVRIGRRLEETLRGRLYNVMTYHALRKTPDIGGGPVSDLSLVRQYISGPGPFAFLDMPWVPVYILVISLVHWQLGLAALVAALVTFAITFWTEHATRTPVSEGNVASIKSTLMADEARRNAEALYTLGMRGAMRDRWVKLQGDAMDHQTAANDVGGSLGSASRVFRMLVQSGMLALGAYLAVLHEITPGMMIACSIIVGRALAPVDQAVGTWQQFLGARKAIDRLNRILASAPEQKERMKLPAPKGKLEVENLAVKAPSGEKMLLQGISFAVEPGQGLGIIGPTGAGKSTLARALVGAMPIAGGKVRLDGATFDQRDIDENGKYIGYLPQDVQMFDGTAAENISRFDPNAKPEDVVAAAKLGNVHELIMRLPQGYETPLGEGGARLSAGQRQRFALARALYGNPVLFILDEPNSNLDAEGEAALDNAIRVSLARGASVIVIAHRPSALASIQRIMVLSDGRAVALGPRDEIMRKIMQRPPGTNVQQLPTPAGGPQAVKVN